MKKSCIVAFAAAFAFAASSQAAAAVYVSIKASDFERGCVRGRVRTGERHDFTAPASATVVTNMSLRGGADDYVRIALPQWPFCFGGVWYRGVVALGDGTLWFGDGVSVDSVFRSLGVVPRDRWASLPDSCRATCPALGVSSPEKLSVVWYEMTRDRLRITWQNALLGRDPACPISYQVDLHRSGDFTMRFDLSRVPSGNAVFARAWRAYGVPAPTTVAWHRLTPEDAQDADRDGDGLHTELEIFGYGTNPLANDTDGDSLYDLPESMYGTSSSTPDTDGDGYGDATDPDPTRPSSWDDGNGDGFPDQWVQKWFGGTAPDPDEDSGGDGVPNLASLYMGVSPVTTWALGTHAQNKLLPPNANAYKFVPSRFSFARPSESLSNMVGRTFSVGRVSPWQQLLLTSDLTLYSGWSAGDVEIAWHAGKESGLAPLDTWDSFRIPVSHSNAFDTIRLELRATGPNPRIDRPIFLVRWVPMVSLGSDANAYRPVGDKYTYIVFNDARGVYSIPCTVATSGYPSANGLDAAVREALNLPMLPGVRLADDRDRLVISGPGTFYVPQHGTQQRTRVIAYKLTWSL